MIVHAEYEDWVHRELWNLVRTQRQGASAAVPVSVQPQAAHGSTFPTNSLHRH
jgi:hypothetical protein|eukprot:COSAG02_NODE_10462_length_1937_cov_1.035365_4_plen_53_part_00